MRQRRILIIGVGVVVLAVLTVLTIYWPWRVTELPRFGMRELPEAGFLKPGAVFLVRTDRATIPHTDDLVLRYHGHLRRVTYPDDLIGHVSIHSETEALQYARLFSSLVPARMPGTDRQEVLHTPSNIRKRDDARQPHLRPDGIVLDQEWRANGLSEPSVKRLGQNFVVTRWLWTLTKRTAVRRYRGSYGTDTVYLVAHTISPHGKITEKILGQRKLSEIALVKFLIM